MKYIYSIKCLLPNTQERGTEAKSFWNEIGIFTSFNKAISILQKLPKEYSYIIEKYKLNIDIMDSLISKKEVSSLCIYHWHYGIDYGYKNNKNNTLEYYLIWPRKLNNRWLKHSIDTLGLIKDKNLIDRYRAYMNACGLKFHNFQKKYG